MLAAKNLCDLHRTVAAQNGARIALRYPQHGLYHDLSWDEYRRAADDAAAGLIHLGVQLGDRVAILSENRVEWLIADHAILSCGAADVPLHAPLAPVQVEYQVTHSEARGIIVSGQAQADKVAEVIERLPQLEFIVSFDPIRFPNSRVRTLTWDGLRHLGTSADRAEIASRESALHSKSLATIIYTSGTTGHPKGVMLSHGNLLTNAKATFDISFMTEDVVLLSWLPYSHIYARTVDHYLTSIGSITVALAESVDTLFANLRQVRPHWLTAVPRVYEKVWSQIKTLTEADRATAIRKTFGSEMRQLTSGGAPLPRYIAEGFFAAGLPLLEGYGLTESSPVISFNSIEQYRVGSVGKPIGDVEVRIADDGEIQTRGPHVMQGYWKNSDATSQTIIDGWLLTGDVGQLDQDGFLYITDRKKDLFVTSAGKNIAPAELERLLSRDEFIDQAVVYGDGRQFVSALLVPNFDRLRTAVAEQGGSLELSGEFVSDSVATSILAARVESVMQQVSQPERVKKFLILARPFAVADDELTATLKVRRRHIINKYEPQLAALYEES